jgi:predicted chitinase
MRAIGVSNTKIKQSKTKKKRLGGNYIMKKRIISVLIIVSMVTAMVPMKTSVSAQNHNFTIFDALNVLKYIVNIESLTPAQRERYDCFGTGVIDIFNALEILKWLVWMDNAFGSVNPGVRPPPPPPPLPPPPIPPPGPPGLPVVPPNIPDWSNRPIIPPQPPPPSDEIVTAAQLRQMGWVEASLTPAIVADLNRTLRQFNITTPPRIQHFISQCAHESGMGRWTKELASGWAYEFRADLGNTQPGDGPRFKGAGYLQMTGRWNYQQFANFVGDQRVMEGVDYVAANYPWLSAGFWWHNAGMNAFIDGGATVEQVTRRVNGGLNGLADRIRLFNLAVQIFR